MSMYMSVWMCLCSHVYVCIPIPCVCLLCEHKVIKLRAFQSGFCLGGDCLQSRIMNKFIVAHLGKLVVSRKGLYC